MKLHKRFTSGAAAILLAGALPVGASTVTYDFGSLSGGTAPSDVPPWLQAVFTDNAQPANTVQLTINAGNLTGGEFLSCLYFNLNPVLDPTKLNFTVSGGSFTDPTVQLGGNSFKAGQDGKFDMLVGFNAGSDRFSAGSSVTFTITGITGLTADDFNFLSTPTAGSGLYSSAAHIEGITDDNASAWINPTSTTLRGNASVDQRVPDGGATLGLLGASLLAIEGFRRTLRTRSSAR